MPLTVTHSKVSAIPDDPAAVAAGEVVPSDWNADHAIVGAAEFDQATKSSSVPASPYNISSADHGKVIKFRDTGTGSYLTAVLPSRASVTDGFYVWLVSNTSSASEYVKLSPNAGDGLNGTAGDIDIYDEGSALVIADANLSNNWLVLSWNRNFAQLAPATTKGDLVVHNGTANVRLPIGTNTHVLTADSSTATGVKWAAAGGGGSPTLTISSKTAAYTVVAGDLGTVINCTANTFTVALTAAATLGAGFNCWIWNTGAGVITIDPNLTETIDSYTTFVLRQGEGTQIVCDGTNWQTGDKKTMRGYSENFASASLRPVASGADAIAIGRSATASGSSSIALGRSCNSSNTYAASIGFTAAATGFGAVAIGNAPSASGNYAVAIGSNSGGSGSQAPTGSAATSFGGSYAVGTDSLAAAVANNTSSYGARAANAIALGYLANANGTRTIALGYNATASNSSAIAISTSYNGSGATASGVASLAIGDAALASGAYSIAIGALHFVNGPSATATGATAIGAGARSLQVGKYSYSGTDLFDGSVFIPGIQYGRLNLGCLTTNATARVLQSDGINGGPAPSTLNQVILPNNSAYAFTGTVVARRNAAGGTDSAAWKIEGLIRREGTAASTTLVASTVTAISNAPGWTLALSADTTNGGLAITATGAASTNIRWFATVQTSEVIYA